MLTRLITRMLVRAHPRRTVPFVAGERTVSEPLGSRHPRDIVSAANGISMARPARWMTGISDPEWLTVLSPDEATTPHSRHADHLSKLPSARAEPAPRLSHKEGKLPNTQSALMVRPLVGQGHSVTEDGTDCAVVKFRVAASGVALTSEPPFFQATRQSAIPATSPSTQSILRCVPQHGRSAAVSEKGLRWAIPAGPFTDRISSTHLDAGSDN